MQTIIRVIKRPQLTSTLTKGFFKSRSRKAEVAQMQSKLEAASQLKKIEERLAASQPQASDQSTKSEEVAPTVKQTEPSLDEQKTFVEGV